MLARWDPLDEIERLTGRFFGDRRSRMEQLTPAVDVFEKDDAIELRVELPGIKAEDVEIDLTDNVLTLCGERKLEHEEEREGYRRIERSFGRFERSFTLPPNVSADDIQAEMSQGVLRLTLPKREEQRGRKIQIGAGAEGAEAGGKVEVEKTKKGERRAEA